MECRESCGACCIAPSIKQAMPNMPAGKAAGELCANLDPVSLQCRIWGQQDYPDFCRGFQPDVDFCGENRDQAMQILSLLEVQTSA
ncbi:MAG: YkgJ family cysteine cluster protein [Cellvibrionaceae bacterium]|nr:YkgJ family cysteine cluster protein [Cellvibrionaceae bacterium]